MAISNWKIINILSLFIIVLSINGCVAVKEQEIPLNIGSVPQGKSVLFIAITDSYPDGKAQAFEINIPGKGKLYPRANALNYTFIEPGQYSFELLRIPQKLNNNNIYHSILAGQHFRLVLLKESIESSESGDSIQVNEYSLLPIKDEGLKELIKTTSIPLVKMEIL